MVSKVWVLAVTSHRWIVWLAALEPLTLPPARMPSGLNATDHALAKPEAQRLVAMSNRHIPLLSAIASVPPLGLKARDEIWPWLPLYSAGTSIGTGLNARRLDGWGELDWCAELDERSEFPGFGEFGDVCLERCHAGPDDSLTVCLGGSQPVW